MGRTSTTFTLSLESLTFALSVLGNLVYIAADLSCNGADIFGLGERQCTKGIEFGSR
jgi:hypothetical protein